jgi:tRNA-specific 2-thiouridylase
MAMSGGVDSSVSAALLVRAGHDVIGVFMRHGEAEPVCDSTGAKSPVHPVAPSPVQAPVAYAPGSPSVATLPIISPRADHKQGCCSASDAEDARRVAQTLEIPFYALNLSDDFARIIDYFVAEYTAARTPNPCVMCNNWLKFGKLFEYADSVGAEFVATGHYAMVQDAEIGGCSGGACPALLRGVDASKDQSYVLFGVSREFLPRMMLPLGGFRKEEIRARAHQLGLRVADKRDSQEICFVTSGYHADFVRRRRANHSEATDCEIDTAGDIVLTDGTVVGSHAGIEGYTIGQRKGLGVAMGEPFYVTHIEAETCRVVIGKREEFASHGFRVQLQCTDNYDPWLGECLEVMATPFPDGLPIPEEVFHTAQDWLAKHWDSGRKILISCAAGQSRSVNSLSPKSLMEKASSQ